MAAGKGFRPNHSHRRADYDRPSFSPEASWASLQRFQNTAYVAERIAALHDLKPSQMQNAKKQARQLRYCLMQAKEYYRASTAVSLATRPILLYYSIMSLALAEILLKSTGDSSLDRAREQHRHHGLTFEHIASSRPNSPISRRLRPY